MDNFIPCLWGRPCFAKAHGPELWVIILEKAWAKLHGSYERIESGIGSDVMRDLTGAPSYVLQTANEKDLADKLLDFDSRDYIMSASCNAKDRVQAEKIEKLGLIAAHAYSLIAVQRVAAGDGQ